MNTIEGSFVYNIIHCETKSTFCARTSCESSDEAGQSVTTLNGQYAFMKYTHTTIWLKQLIGNGLSRSLP